MNVTLQYFDSCPNWKNTDQHLKDAIVSGELNVSIEYQLVESPEQAERYGFHGSPSILIDGVDPFATAHTSVGYACRTYFDDSGRPTDTPSVEQIVEAFRAHLVELE